MQLQGAVLEALCAELRSIVQHVIHSEMRSLQDSLSREIRSALDHNALPCTAGSSEQDEATPAMPSRKLKSDTLHGAMSARNDSRESQNRPRTLELFRGEMLPESESDSISYKRRERQSAVASMLPGRTTAIRKKRATVSPVKSMKPNHEKTWMDHLNDGAVEVVRHAWFDYSAVLIVLLNSLWIGFQTDFVARHWTNVLPGYFLDVDWAFCIVAFVEILFRLAAFGTAFFVGEGARWNMFDFVVVMMQILDAAAATWMNPDIAHQGKLNGIRILKMVRFLRVARFAIVFPELNVLISSVVDSLYSLLWTLILIVTFLYAIAIWITQLVNEHKIEVGLEDMENHQEEVLEFYGSLDQTMISLYMIISEGMHWYELMEPLKKNISPWMQLVFVIFVGFMIFAMMNVITACFVDNAMKIAAKAEKEDALNAIWEKLTAECGAGELITRDAFVQHFEHPAMWPFLELTGAEGEDPGEVFALIDENGDGALTADEFISTCAKLMVPTRALQVAKLTVSQKEGVIKGITEVQEQISDKQSSETKEMKKLIEEQTTRQDGSLHKIMLELQQRGDGIAELRRLFEAQAQQASEQTNSMLRAVQTEIQGLTTTSPTSPKVRGWLNSS